VKSIKELISLIKELLKTSKGRKILFFSFYLFFLIVLILIVRFSDGTNHFNEEYESGSSSNISVKEINNFSYNYKIMLDGVLHDYVGQRNDNKEKFTYNNSSYYSEDGNYFINNSNMWLKVDNPVKFNYFVDLGNVNKILEKATSISKTEYESGKVSYNYEISSNTLIALIDNIDTDFDDKPNTIIINVDEDNNTNEIKFNLGSYCINTKQCNKSLDIELYYDDFNKVDDIKSVLDNNEVK